MSTFGIGIPDPYVLHQTIKELLKSIDAYPSEAWITSTSGPSGRLYGPAADKFGVPLDDASVIVAGRSKDLREKLVALNEAIRATIKDFEEQDEIGKAEAERVTKILDNAIVDSRADEAKASPGLTPEATQRDLPDRTAP